MEQNAAVLYKRVQDVHCYAVEGGGQQRDGININTAAADVGNSAA